MPVGSLCDVSKSVGAAKMSDDRLALARVMVSWVAESIIVFTESTIAKMQNPEARRAWSLPSRVMFPTRPKLYYAGIDYDDSSHYIYSYTNYSIACLRRCCSSNDN